MNEILEDRVTAHLETIESVYGIAILNKKEVAGWVSDMTRDEQTALTITTALNTWVLMNSTGGSIKIPLNLLNQIHENLEA